MHVNNSLRKKICLCMVSFGFTYTISVILYVYFVREQVYPLLDIITLVAIQMLTFSAFLSCEHHFVLHDRTKKLTAKLQLRCIQFLYLFGVLLFLLSYLYIFLEVFIDESLSLNQSASFQLTGFLLLLTTTLPGIEPRKK